MGHMNLEELLSALKEQCEKRPVDGVGILRAVEGVLGFLVVPENNTDENCRRVDSFVTFEILDGLIEFGPADDVGRIVEDMMLLHDTHTAPDVAENFQSTPEMLLGRTRELLAKMTT